MRELALVLTLTVFGSPTLASPLFCTPTLDSLKQTHFVFNLKDSSGGPPPIPYSLYDAKKIRNAGSSSAPHSWKLTDICEAQASCKQTRYVRTTEYIAETVVIEETAAGRDGQYKNTFHVDLRTGVGFILSSSEKFQIKTSDLYPNGVGQMLIIPFNCSEKIPAGIELPN